MTSNYETGQPGEEQRAKRLGDLDLTTLNEALSMQIVSGQDAIRHLIKELGPPKELNLTPAERRKLLLSYPG